MRRFAAMYQLSEDAREQLMTRPTECCDDRSSIQEKVRLASGLYDKWGDPLLNDAPIGNLLAELKRNREASIGTMLDLGIVAACKHCDEEEGGSCCGVGLENKFDVHLLLINLLLGVSLPDHHLRPDSCYLLTDKGCMLKVRLVLCVDFLCPKIVNRLTRDELIRLQTVSGDELMTGFKLYDAIKKFLRNTGQ